MTILDQHQASLVLASLQYSLWNDRELSSEDIKVVEKLIVDLDKN